MAGRARRRKRLLTAAIVSVIVVLACVAIAIGISRRQAVRARDEARAEAGRREAAQLLSLGRLRLADHPNAALAYAIASLERSDNDPARRFAVEALWQGPPALYLPPDPVIPISLQWSSDGRWITVGGKVGPFLLSRENGERRQISSSRDIPFAPTSDGQRLVTFVTQAGGAHELYKVWTLPEGRLERTLQYPVGSMAILRNDRLLTFAPDGPAEQGERQAYVVRRISLDGSTQQVLGRWELLGPAEWNIDPSGTWIVSMQRGRLLQQRLDALSAPARVLGEHQDASLGAGLLRDRAVTGDSRGEVRIWNVPSARLERTLKSPSDARGIALDPQGRFAATGPLQGIRPRSLFLFDLAAPRTAAGMPLLGETRGALQALEFSPDGSWLASVDVGNVTLWNMRGAHSIVLGRQDPPFSTVAFTPNGDLLSMSEFRPLRRWLLSPAAAVGVQTLLSGAPITGGGSLLVDPGGRFVLTPVGLRVVRLDGSKPANYELKPGLRMMPMPAGANSMDPSGRFLALSTEEDSIQIFNLATGELRQLDKYPKSDERCEIVGSEDAGLTVPVWLRDGRLLSDGDWGLREWDPATGKSRILRPCRQFNPNGFKLFAGPEPGMVLRLDPAEAQGSVSSLSVFDLASRSTREISSHANMISSLALDASGTILVTGDKNGVVRVGPVTGEEPHLLFGHTGPVSSVAVSPDGRWIASGSDDGTIRLWPMPDLSKPPLHTLPHDALLAKLKSLTNLRAVRDPSSGSGWKIETSPFPGWAIAPGWQP
jgi:WD40 repeat protein